MKVYVVKDYTGAKSIHLAIDRDAAIVAHLIHYGILWLPYEPKVKCAGNLPKKRRERICWNTICCMVAARS